MVFWGSVLMGCTKDDKPTSKTHGLGRLELRVFHQVDGQSLQMDSIRYTNAAGYDYSVTKLQYYLDSFRLMLNGRMIQVKGIFWMDARNFSTSILLDSIPEGAITGIEFEIGIRSTLNIPNGLPTTPENLKMVWPTEMGGGYHFLMLEGHYRDRSHQIKGYTLHLGTNKQRVHHQLIPVTLDVNAGQTTIINLGMQVNEWFVHPFTYDFEISGNHIMGIDSSMQKIRDNGKDVFKSL